MLQLLLKQSSARLVRQSLKVSEAMRPRTSHDHQAMPGEEGWCERRRSAVNSSSTVNVSQPGLEWLLVSP